VEELMKIRPEVGNTLAAPYLPEVDKLWKKKEMEKLGSMLSGIALIRFVCD